MTVTKIIVLDKLKSILATTTKGSERRGGRGEERKSNYFVGQHFI
jgi:hypothetical protein